MKSAWKGALLSALVFPGAGQLAVKRPLRGLAIIGAAIAGLIVFVVKATAIAVQAMEAPLNAGGALDMATVNAAAAQAVASADGLVMRGALLWILLCWIFSTVDAYFLGRKLDDNA